MTDQTFKKLPLPSDVLVESIVKNNFVGIDSIKTRNSDSLDFHDVAIWSIVYSIRAAYQAGYQAALQDAKDNENL